MTGTIAEGGQTIYKYAPLFYVSVRWDIHLTSRGRKNLARLKEAAEDYGFTVPVPEELIQGIRFTSGSKPLASLEPGKSYCFFKPGEQTQFILDIPPDEHMAQARLNTAEYVDFDSFSKDIESLRRIIVSCDENANIKSASINYVDAFIPAPEKKLKNYFNEEHIVLPQLDRINSSGEYPYYTQKMEYPASKQAVHYGWELFAQPFKNQETKTGINPFPSNLSERINSHTMDISIKIGWAAKSDGIKLPTDTHYGSMLFFARKEYPSLQLAELDIVGSMRELRDPCHSNFELLASEEAKEEWEPTKE